MNSRYSRKQEHRIYQLFWMVNTLSIVFVMHPRSLARRKSPGRFRWQIDSNLVMFLLLSCDVLGIELPWNCIIKHHKDIYVFCKNYARLCGNLRIVRSDAIFDQLCGIAPSHFIRGPVRGISKFKTRSESTGTNKSCLVRINNSARLSFSSGGALWISLSWSFLGYNYVFTDLPTERTLPPLTLLMFRYHTKKPFPFSSWHPIPPPSFWSEGEVLQVVDEVWTRKQIWKWGWC